MRPALRWVAAESTADPEFTADVLGGLGAPASSRWRPRSEAAGRPVDVCVEIGLAGGRTGCRDAAAVDEVARAAAECPALRLVGVAGYEAALGHDVTPDGAGARHRLPVAAAVGRRAVGRRVRDRQRRRDGRRQHVLRRGRRCAEHGSVAGRRGAHHRPQRLLSDPRPRAVRADVTAARRAAARAGSVGAGDVAARSRIWRC